MNHACPECPTPALHVGQLHVPPSATCAYCAGTGLVSEATLFAWQTNQWRGAQV